MSTAPSPRYIYLHGFASGPLSKKAQFFRGKLAAEGISLEVLTLDEGDFEHLTLTRQLNLIGRTLQGQSAVLIGSSMGGYLAALYGSQHPEVERMFLLAPAFGFGSRWVETFGAEKIAEWRNRGYAEVYHYGTGGTRRLSADLLNDASSYPDRPACRQPVLIFHGIRDVVVPISASEQWVSENPASRLVRVDSDHELLDVLEPVWLQSRGFLCNLQTLRPPTDTLEG